MKSARLALFGMMLAVGSSAAVRAADWSQAKKITVGTTEYAFQPANLTFQQGKTYRLRVDNRGKETHEFTAPDFFKAIEMKDTRALTADRTEIVVQPGHHKDLYFVAKQPGSYKLICSDHDWAGMTGDITISP